VVGHGVQTWTWTSLVGWSRCDEFVLARGGDVLLGGIERCSLIQERRDDGRGRRRSLLDDLALLLGLQLGEMSSDVWVCLNAGAQKSER